MLYVFQHIVVGKPTKSEGSIKFLDEVVSQSEESGV